MMKWNEIEYEMQMSFIELKSIESAFVSCFLLLYMMMMKKMMIMKSVLKRKKLSRYVWFVNENIYDSMFDMYARYIWYLTKKIILNVHIINERRKNL